MKTTFKYSYRPRLVVTRKNGMMSVCEYDRNSLSSYCPKTQEFEAYCSPKEYLLNLDDYHTRSIKLVWYDDLQLFTYCEFRTSGHGDWFRIQIPPHIDTYIKARNWAMDVADGARNYTV